MDENTTPVDISVAAGAGPLQLTVGGIIYRVGPVKLLHLVKLQTVAADIPADRLARSWFELLSILVGVLLQDAGVAAGMSVAKSPADWVQDKVLAGEVPALDNALRPVLLDALGNG